MFKMLFGNWLMTKIYKLYLSTTLMPKEFVLKEDDKCLLLAPHSDDESIGMGGLLALKGEQFKITCLTNGYKGIIELPKDEAIAKRKQEFINAVGKIKIGSFEFLGIDDRKIVTEYETFSKIDVENFNYIFVPNPIDQHIDHKATSFNLARLLREKRRKLKPDLKIVLYEVWAALPLPNSYVDISSVIETKREMINQHQSQIFYMDYTNRTIGLNSYRGLIANKAEYAEAFSVVDVNTFFKTIKGCL